MTLREIIAAFAAVEAGLEITEPRKAKIKRVYSYLPPAKNALETPCFMHQFRRLSASRVVGSRESDFTVRVQLLVAPVNADTDVWSEVAAAFDEVLIAAFDTNVMLGSTSAFQRITDEQTEYQPLIINWNGLDYVGCQYDYKVSAHAVVAFAA